MIARVSDRKPKRHQRTCTAEDRECLAKRLALSPDNQTLCAKTERRLWAEHVVTFAKGGRPKPICGNGARGWRSATRSASSFLTPPADAKIPSAVADLGRSLTGRPVIRLVLPCK